MPFLIALIAIAVAAFFLWRKYTEAAAERAEAERKNLATFIRQDATPSATTVTTVDFPSLRMSIEVFYVDPPTYDPLPSEDMHVRRLEGGAWERKYTDEAFDLRRKWLQRRVEEMSEEAQEQLDELATEPRWLSLDDELSGSVESQYQRYVAQ